MDLPNLSHLAKPGTRIALRVTPKAARDRIKLCESGIKVYVTSVPEGGKANCAVAQLLAKATGVPPTRLTLIQGGTSRDKVFQVDPD